MTTLETLLHDPDTAGVWNLVPDKSTIAFKIKNMWGLVPVKGQFTVAAVAFGVRLRRRPHVRFVAP